MRYEVYENRVLTFLNHSQKHDTLAYLAMLAFSRQAPRQCLPLSAFAHAASCT